MDYFEQQMKDIAVRVISEEHPHLHGKEELAAKIARALRERSIVQSTGIGGRDEYERSVA